MILESIRIENFRSFEDETIAFDRYTCLVGPNGAGKSTVLTALNVFFRNSNSSATNVLTLCEEDFHHKNTSEPVKITLVFAELSEAAKNDLKHYVRQERLVVSAKAEWNSDSESAEVKQFGSRLVMKAFAPYFQAIDAKAKAGELKQIYETLREQFPSLDNATTNSARESSLRSYEEAHPEQCELIEDTAQFFGFTKGANFLSKYVQWVYVPAVKDASTEQEESGRTALGQLLERTVRTKVDFKEPISELKKLLKEKYDELVKKESAVLDDLQVSIQSRLQDWSTPGARLQLKWDYDQNKSLVVAEPSARAFIGEGSFVGEVARLGHGLQRAFLVSVLHELASSNSEDGPTLLLGFEEPELYQHPPQAQHMAGVLEELAEEKHNSQIIVSTHSPYFISSNGFENVRMVRKVGSNCSRVSSTTYQKVEEIVAKALDETANPPSVTMTKIEQIMQPSKRELYFTRVVVLVEGIEDVAFLVTHLHLQAKWNEFRRLGCHFVVADGKTNLSRLVAIAKELQIPSFVMFDGDGNDKEKERQRRDNGCLLRLCGNNTSDPLPQSTLWGDNHVVWPFSIADAVKECVQNDIWSNAEEKIRQLRGYPNKQVVKSKNNLLIAGVLEELDKNGVHSVTLTKVCDSILKFAQDSI